MTESEWLVCGDPDPMLELLRDKFSGRKLRLFMVACCRRVWDALGEEDEYRQQAVKVAERYADGLADRDELESAFGELTDGNPIHVWDDCANATVADFVEFYAVSLASAECLETGLMVVGEDYERSDAIRRAEGVEQAALLRDIFGNPFRPLTLNPAWLTTDVVSLAQAAYDKRRLPAGNLNLKRLGVLADALEDAGAVPDLVEHLRGPGPHVRGCFVVDAVLGKQ